MHRHYLVSVILAVWVGPAVALADYVSGVWTNYADDASVIAWAEMGWSASSERNTVRPEPSWSVDDVVIPNASLQISRVEWIGVRDPRYDYDADFQVMGSMLDPNTGGLVPDPSNRVTISEQAFEIEPLLLVDPDVQIYRGVLDFSTSPIDVIGTHFYVGTRLVGVTDDGGPNDGYNAVAVSAISDSATTFGGMTQGYFRGPSWGFPSWTAVNELFGTLDDQYELAYRVVFVPEPASATIFLTLLACCSRRRFGRNS